MLRVPPALIAHNACGVATTCRHGVAAFGQTSSGSTLSHQQKKIFLASANICASRLSFAGVMRAADGRAKAHNAAGI
jgi:hypothetical protein